MLKCLDTWLVTGEYNKVKISEHRDYLLAVRDVVGGKAELLRHIFLFQILLTAFGKRILLWFQIEGLSFAWS